ncbi:MAG: hypothetical protein D6753_07565 [Planctomycetota bacterium]|nr:MAG: hypothetical protein D6753_07565 [Planctomycetota bacterium]
MQRRYQHGCGCDACDAGCGACDAGGNIGHAPSPAVEAHGNRAFHTPPSNTRRIGDGSESANSPPSLVRRRGIDTAPVFPLEREPSNGRNPNNSAAHQSADRIEERSPSASAKSFVGTETPVDAGPADRPTEQAAEGGNAPTWRTRGRSDSIPSGRPAAIPQRHAEPIPDHLQNPFEDDVPAEGPGRPIETLPGGGPQPPFSEAFDPQAQEGSSHTATSSADTKSLAATHSSRRSAARRGNPTISTGHQVIPASAVAERFPPEPLPLRPVRPLGTDRSVER